MILTTEQQKEAIEFAKIYEKETGSFPTKVAWVKRNVAFKLDNGEEIYFPYSKSALTDTWGEYGNFRETCGLSFTFIPSNNMILTTEQQEQAIEFAKEYKKITGSFPTQSNWVISNIAFKLDDGKEIYFPFAKNRISATWEYGDFRKLCGESKIYVWKGPITLDVLREYCVEDKCSETVNTPCWIWQGSIDVRGYAVKGIENKRWYLHRYVLIVLKNKSDPSTQEVSFTVDHKCRVRNCINPDHLRWATRSEQRKNQNRPKIHAKKQSEPPRNHQTLTERVQWYEDQGTEDEKTGCLVLPLATSGHKESGYQTFQYKNRVTKKKKTYVSHVAIYLLHRDGEVTKESYEAFTKDKMVRHMCVYFGVTETANTCNNIEHLKELPKTAEGRRQNMIDTSAYHKINMKPNEVQEVIKLWNDSEMILKFDIVERYDHIASIFKVTRGVIKDIVKGRTHTHVTKAA